MRYRLFHRRIFIESTETLTIVIETAVIETAVIESAGFETAPQSTPMLVLTAQGLPEEAVDSTPKTAMQLAGGDSPTAQNSDKPTPTTFYQERERRMTPIFLIVGAPATGKSTASRALAAQFPKSIAIGVDELRTMVVAGLAQPSAEWSTALTEQLSLVRASVTAMAQRYQAAGYAVIIDDFWDPHTQMSEYSELFTQAEFQRVLLYPKQQKAHEQNRKRSGAGPLQAYLDEGINLVYADLNKVVADLPQQGWQVLDTTADTVEETVKRLLALLA